MHRGHRAASQPRHKPDRAAAGSGVGTQAIGSCQLIDGTGRVVRREQAPLLPRRSASLGGLPGLVWASAFDGTRDVASSERPSSDNEGELGHARHGFAFGTERPGVKQNVGAYAHLALA